MTTSIPTMGNVNDTLLTSFLNQFVNQNFLEDVINVTLYQADVDTFAQTSDHINTTEKIKTFLLDIYKDVDRLKKINALGNYPINLIKMNLKFATRVIDLKNTIGSKLLTYDTLEDNFNKNELQINTLIKRIKDNRIKDIDEFKTKLNDVINKIQIGDEIRSIKSSLTGLDNVVKSLNSKDCQLLNVIFEYRNAIDRANDELTKLRSVNLSESLSNSIMIGGSNYTPTSIIDNTFTYLSSGYAFYNSGYDLIDTNINGIESANFHLICGPSNNAKSIFMINLLRGMSLNNKQEYEENDLNLYITLEDDIYKLQRRFGAVLGNLSQDTTKYMYASISKLVKKRTSGPTDNYLELQIKQLLNNYITNSMYNTVGKFVPFDLKHYRDVITPTTVRQIIEYHKSRGRRVRAVFIDYMDCMVPSSSKYTDFTDYNAHGILTQELRNLAQEYLVPVITITQATRGTEGVQSMTNDNIGDSIKKIRYSDYVYMVRLRRDMTILDQEVKQCIIDPNELQSSQPTTFTDVQNQNNTKLIPFEVKITKAKDGDRDMTRYHVFSGENLRIYQLLSSYYADVPELQSNTSKLTAEIERVKLSTDFSAFGSNSLL